MVSVFPLLLLWPRDRVSGTGPPVSGTASPVSGTGFLVSGTVFRPSGTAAPHVGTLFGRDCVIAEIPGGVAPARLESLAVPARRRARARRPEGLRVIKGLHDEALKGDLKGSRSSCLNQGWRVLYKVVSDQVTVLVERVSKHDYRA